GDAGAGPGSRSLSISICDQLFGERREKSRWRDMRLQRDIGRTLDAAAPDHPSREFDRERGFAGSNRPHNRRVRSEMQQPFEREQIMTRAGEATAGGARKSAEAPAQGLANVRLRLPTGRRLEKLQIVFVLIEDWIEPVFDPRFTRADDRAAEAVLLELALPF